MFTKNRIQSAALLLSFTTEAGQVVAHSGAMGIVEERTDMMSTLGNHAKAVGDMLKGRTSKGALGGMSGSASIRTD